MGGMSGIRYTEDQIITLRAMYATLGPRRLGEMFGKTTASVMSKASKLGLTRRYPMIRPSVYLAYVTEEAAKSKVPVERVFSRSRRAPVAAVRQRVWHRFKQDGRGVTAIARAAGRDVSTVISGIRKIEALAA